MTFSICSSSVPSSRIDFTLTIDLDSAYQFLDWPRSVTTTHLLWNEDRPLACNIDLRFLFFFFSSVRRERTCVANARERRSKKYGRELARQGANPRDIAQRRAIRPPGLICRYLQLQLPVDFSKRRRYCFQQRTRANINRLDSLELITSSANNDSGRIDVLYERV